MMMKSSTLFLLAIIGNCGFAAANCDPNPCLNGGTCVDLEETFFCQCPEGFEGFENCAGPCDPNPCENGGTCVEASEDSFTCLCVGDIGGELCETTPGPTPGPTLASSSSTSSKSTKSPGKGKGGKGKGKGGKGKGGKGKSSSSTKSPSSLDITRRTLALEEEIDDATTNKLSFRKTLRGATAAISTTNQEVVGEKAFVGKIEDYVDDHSDSNYKEQHPDEVF